MIHTATLQTKRYFATNGGTMAKIYLNLVDQPLHGWAAVCLVRGRLAQGTIESLSPGTSSASTG